MTRRRSKVQDEATGRAIVFVVALFLAAYALTTLAVYGGIILVIVGPPLFIYSRFRAPSTADISKLKASPEAHRWRQFRRKLRKIRAHRQKIFETGIALGLDCRKGRNDDGLGFFDERKRGARQQNQILYELDQRIQELDSALAILEPSLELDLEELRRRSHFSRTMAACWRAYQIAVVSYIVIVVFTLLFGGATADDASQKIARFTWFDSIVLHPYYAAFVSGTLGSMISGGFTWIIQFNSIVDPMAVLSLENIMQEHPEIEASSAPKGRDEVPHKDDIETEDIAPVTPNWCKVFGVSPNTPEDEVTRVYHAECMKWHPDLIAQTGRDLAEADVRSKDLNLAYEEFKEWLRSSRGEPSR